VSSKLINFSTEAHIVSLSVVVSGLSLKLVLNIAVSLVRMHEIKSLLVVILDL
jgi:hypothetical protein